MPLPISEQARLAIESIPLGDIDLFEKVLTDPMAVTPADQRTVAEKLGFRGGWLNAVVNVAADPTVWLAAWMSRRFSTLGWLTGAIPTRFVGTANEWTGVSQYVRPVETYFRGTPVPRLVAVAERRRAEVMKAAAPIFEAMNRPNWKDEMPVVSLLLEGQSHPGATPELQRVAGEIRGHMNGLWELLRKTQAIRGGFEGTEITRARAEPFAPHEAPRFLRDYLPHIPLLGDEGVMSVSARDVLKKLGAGQTKQLLDAVGEDPSRIWSVDQVGRLSSDFGRYQTMLNNVKGQLWNQHLFVRQRHEIPLQSMMGQQLFVTDLNVVLQKYVSSVARTYAVNAPLSEFERLLAAAQVRRPDGTTETILPSHEPIMAQVINSGLGAAGARFDRRSVPGTSHVNEVMNPASANPLVVTGLRHLVRSVGGRASEGEILWGNTFAAVGRHFDSAVGAISNKQKTEVDYAMRALQRTRQWPALANGVTSYFHSTTLGVNPWSAMQNLFQPLLTTAPAIGLGPTLSGMGELRKRLPQYAGEIRRQHGLLKSGSSGLNRAIEPLHRMGEAADKAFEKVFPELAAAGVKPDVRHFDIDPASLQTTTGGRLWRNYDAFAKFLLQPFNHAELANQVTTFFGARKALQQQMRLGAVPTPRDLQGRPLAGKAFDDWLSFESGMVVNATQFRPHPGGRTIWQGNMPSFLTQFTTFPVRAGSYMVESTIRGAMTEKELETAGLMSRITGGRNLGTLARMFLYGRIAQHGAREALGIDLGNVLGIAAPFSVAPPGQVFAPYSAPPVVTTAFGMVSAATTRDVKEMRPMTIPGIGDIPIPKTLVPGGVALGRAMRALQQWRPDLGGSVDENERLMYRGNTTDLLLSMIGVPLEKNRRVREAIERSHDVRMRVNEFRREYALARVNYDTGRMTQLQAQWAEAFPDWPALQVSDRDVDRYRSASRIPVIERMLKTMGDGGRYLQREIYEVDPTLVAPPPAMDLSFLRAG